MSDDIAVYKDIIDNEGVGNNLYYKIKPKSISEFFQESYSLIIPDYQRPYSWSENNIKQLLKDVESALEEEKGWFLGPIFTTHKTTSGNYDKEILDGQQRLTTIQLLLREAYCISYSFKDPLDPKTLNELRFLNEKINRCIVVTGQNAFEAKFHTDVAVRKDLEKYITDGLDISDYDQWVSSYDEFDQSLGGEDLDWSETVKTVKTALSTLRNYLVKLIGSEDHSFDRDKFENYKTFMSKLLNEFWLIEIPLRKEDFILDIFESLNNRGKPLTLVDILRFKTLTLCHESKLNSVQKRWQDIFKLLQRLSTLKAIKDEDDFFKVVLNTYTEKHNGETKKESFISLFEDKFGTNDGIEEFIDDVLRICQVLVSIYTPVDSTNRLINTLPKNKKDEGISILQLLRLALKCTDNTRYLVFYAARKIDMNPQDSELMLSYFYDVVRAVIFFDIYMGTKSNEVRPAFLEVIQKIDSTDLTFENFLEEMEWDKMNDSTYDYNLLNTTNSDYANMLIAFYQFHRNQEQFTNGSAKQYYTFTCEHFMPVKWMENWGDARYTRDDVFNYLDELSSSGKYNDLNVDALVNRIKNLGDKVLLKPYDNIEKKKLSQENSVIQFIGNKWIITGPSNSSLNNDSFQDKMTKAEELMRSGRLFIPSSDDKAGLSNYSQFGFKDIFDRSFSIIDHIIGVFPNRLD